MKGKKILEDDVNRIIVSEMYKDGRIKYTSLARKLKITPAAVKERIERLIENKLIKVSVLFNTEKTFPVTAAIGIESDSEGTDILVRKLRNCPLVFHMSRTSGMHNLILSIVSENMEQLESLLNNQIRSEPGIRHVEVNIGNVGTVVPEFQQLRLLHTDNTEHLPCGLRYDEKIACLNCPGLLNVKKIRKKRKSGD